MQENESAFVDEALRSERDAELVAEGCAARALTPPPRESAQTRNVAAHHC